MDGLRERHDKSVCRDGVFDKAVDAIREAKRRGFRVTTNTTFFSDDTPETVREVLDFLNDELGVDQMMISPGYAYEKAPDQEHFPGVEQTRKLFRAAFADGRRRQLAAQPLAAVPRLPRGQGRLRLHRVGDPELLDLRLAAALLPDVRRLRLELPGAARGDRLGPLRPRPRPRCDNCMAHCGYEPTAVNETVRAPHKALARCCGGEPPGAAGCASR